MKKILSQAKVKFLKKTNKLIVTRPGEFEADNMDDEIIQELKKQMPFVGVVEIVYEHSADDIEKHKIHMEETIAAIPREPAVQRRRIARAKVGDNLIGSQLKGPDSRIAKLQQGKKQTFVGILCDVNLISTRKELVIGRFAFSDKEQGVFAKIFFKNSDEADEAGSKLEIGQQYIVRGTLQFDSFDDDDVFMISDMNKFESFETRTDDEEEKRTELYVHSNLSEQDGLDSIENIIDRAVKWGHSAVAITDHGTVQAFAHAYEHARDKDIKLIYGIDAYMVDDVSPFFRFLPEDHCLEDLFIVFDIETTGLSARNDRLIEIGAVKLQGGNVVDSFQRFINPEMPIPPEITELTGIKDADVANAPSEESVLKEFYKFMDGGIPVAHNADFDISFINIAAEKYGFKPLTGIDTIRLARQLLPVRRYGLARVAKFLGIEQLSHHRADDDARVTAQIFIHFLNIFKKENIKTLGDANRYFKENFDPAKERPVHAVVLLKNQESLVPFYKMISNSYTKNFAGAPHITKSDIEKYRQHLIVGSGDIYGEVYNALNVLRPEENLREIVDFYDYLQIFPTETLMEESRSGIINTAEQIEEINRRIVRIGDEMGKITVASGNLHFLDPDQELARNIIIHGKNLRGMEYEGPFYFRTTAEMLENFEYMAERARELVIDNTKKIADLCESIIPIPNEKCPPTIKGSEEELKQICYKNAHSRYGDPLPDIVEARISKELKSIIGNGFAAMYMISRMMVKRSEEDGYSVGSRGSVGSSVVAFLGEISDVNPLPAHYYCPKCQKTEFVETKLVGIDLPEKTCPVCNTKYLQDGFDIPFEAFLGFKGDKEPDIDLNFASVYQATAQKFPEEVFGEGYTFKVSTIGTYAEKTAYANVMKYDEDHGIERHRADVLRLRNDMLGVKRSTGQHPAGVLVLPKGRNIYEFTPVQFAKNDKEEGILTTHYDYKMLEGTLLKLDILGHESPTMLRMLEDLTGIHHRDIPLNDPETLKIFSSSHTLKLDQGSENHDKPGTLGIPEFGTPFVLTMIEEVQPKTFSDLVRISGLSHGTDVWVGNARDIVMKGEVPFEDVISTREDIMNMLIAKGCDNQTAFWVMENVRKGKGLTDEELAELKRLEMPLWYINSCLKIKYLFPKAHAAAYVMQSFKIAYYKVHHPAAFYATYFSNKVQNFDPIIIAKGKREIEEAIAEIDGISKFDREKKRDEGKLAVLRAALEMYERGITVSPIDIMKSKAHDFVVEGNTLLPPILSISGVGENAAQMVCDGREGVEEFLSIEDFKTKTGCNKNVIETLKIQGALDGLPDTNQLSFF